jgi:peptidoglycan/xylan/chitin deacetylase (PgdA/CDA1 family)
MGKIPAWSADGRPNIRLMNSSELRELDSAGMEIGSHTVSHIRLTGAPDSVIRSELSMSKKTLEDILGYGIVSFAYPYGAWDRRCEIAVSESGYLYACTCQTGMALKDKHPLRLRRLAIFNHDNAGTLARKLALLSNDCSWVRVARYFSDRAIHRLGVTR